MFTESGVKTNIRNKLVVFSWMFDFIIEDIYYISLDLIFINIKKWLRILCVYYFASRSLMYVLENQKAAIVPFYSFLFFIIIDFIAKFTIIVYIFK